MGNAQSAGYELKSGDRLSGIQRAFLLKTAPERLSPQSLRQLDCKDNPELLVALWGSQMETIKVEMTRHAPCEHCRITALYLKEIQC
jgi:hypothetical protein